MQLLRSQKNTLFDLIEKWNLSPSMFILEEFQEIKYKDKSLRVKHLNSDFYFSIFYSPNNNYYYEFSPSYNRMTKNGELVLWNQVTDVYIDWLDALKRETEIVDKWAQLKSEMPDFKLTEASDEGKFSYDEVIQIETKIHLLKSKILEIPLTPNQAETINQKLDYCIELAKTANKFDWGSYFIGVITNIILTLSVTTDNVKHIWEAVKFVFNNFLLK